MRQPSDLLIGCTANGTTCWLITRRMTTALSGRSPASTSRRSITTPAKKSSIFENNVACARRIREEWSKALTAAGQH